MKLLLTRKYNLITKSLKQVKKELDSETIDVLRKHFQRPLQIEYWTKNNYKNSSEYIADFFSGGFTKDQFISVPKKVLINGFKKLKVVDKKYTTRILEHISSNHYKATELLSDAQGRLLGAILLYLKDDFALQDDLFIVDKNKKKHNLKGYKFSNLPREWKKILLNTKLIFRVADENSIDATALIKDIVNMNRTTAWDDFNINLTSVTPLSSALLFDVGDDAIITPFLKNFLTKYKKKNYNMDKRGHLKLFAEMLYWSYKREASNEKNINYILENMNKSDVEKHLNNTKKIFKFIINHTNDLTNFKSIENFRNLYMTLDLMTNNTIYEVGINCKLSDIIDGEKLITDFLEDEFLRSTNDDINFITLNGIKSKREDGFLFNMDGHIMKNIKWRLHHIRNDIINKRAKQWEEIIIKNIRYISQQTRDKALVSGLNKKDPYKDPHTAKNRNVNDFFDAEDHHVITIKTQKKQKQYTPNENNIVKTEKNREIGGTTLKTA